MDALTVVTGYIVVLAFFVYVMLFGASGQHRDGMVGRLNLFLTGGCCDSAKSLIFRFLPASWHQRYDDFEETLCFTRHPLLQILYVTIISTGFGFFFFATHEHIPGPHVSELHWYAAWVCVAFCFGTFVLACRADPGFISAETADHYLEQYPLDNLIFHAKECSTCKFQRPGRSKHCRLCNRCVARYDHHCSWLNTCVGERNFRWFILFLVSHTALLFYGVTAMTMVLVGVAREQRLLEMYYKDKDGEIQQVGYGVAAQYLLATMPKIASFALFCLLMGLVLVGFTGMHIYQAARGKTTSETFKWSDFDDEVADRVRRQELREKLAAQSTKRKGKKNRAQTPADAAADDDTDEVDWKNFRAVNIYDKGVVNNLMAAFFPPPARVKRE